MRAVVLIWAMLAVLSSRAQSVFSTDSPALGTPSAVLSPASPALPLAPGIPGFTNVSGLETNLTLANLAQLLINAQSSLQQALPVLAAFNDGFEFISVATNGTASTTAIGPFGNVAVSSGANAAANTGGFTGTANAFGLPAGVVAFPITRDTLRALLVLQGDMQRILPILNALNGGGTNGVAGTALAPGFVPQGLTNLFNPTSGF